MATAVLKTKRKPTGAAAMGAGPGRPKGLSNKMPLLLKAMILKALDNAGGVQYLEARANDPRTASAFMALVGKVLPMTVEGPGPNGEHRFRLIEVREMPWVAKP